MQSNVNTQVYLAQTIVKEFVQKRNPDFQIFVEIWRNLDGKKIHDYPSPRSLIFGRIQAAYQTFLGFIVYKSKDLEIISGIYGLYILYQTQNNPLKEQILVTSDELLIIQEKISKFDFLLIIFKYLIQSQAFIFSAVSYIIRTPKTEYPQRTVLSERPQFSQIMETKKEKFIRQKYLSQSEIMENKDEQEEYHTLLSEIFQNK